MAATTWLEWWKQVSLAREDGMTCLAVLVEAAMGLEGARATGSEGEYEGVGIEWGVCA